MCRQINILPVSGAIPQIELIMLDEMALRLFFDGDGRSRSGDCEEVERSRGVAHLMNYDSSLEFGFATEYRLLELCGISAGCHPRYSYENHWTSWRPAFLEAPRRLILPQE